ncbi:hypothetical protein [Clostridium sp.]|uniref:hypothetical protein n=1 Tax=Clostridium sp. TaxID=1506 RepID=UPI00262ABE53|nr:hypothetical protein [Clostridium sp.]
MNNKNIQETHKVVASEDMQRLSQQIDETVITLDNLLVFKNNSKCTLCKGFKEVDKKIEEIKLLIETIQTTVYKCCSEDDKEDNLIYECYAFNDFYN